MYRWVGELELRDRTRLKSLVAYTRTYQAVPQVIIVSPAFLGYERMRLALSPANWEKLIGVLELGLWRSRRKIVAESRKSRKAYYQYGWDYYDFAENWFHVLKNLQFLDEWTTLENLVDGTLTDSLDGLHYVRLTPGMGLVTEHHIMEVIRQAELQNCQHYPGLWITDGYIEGDARRFAEACDFQVIDRYDSADYSGLFEYQQIWGEIRISSRSRLVIRSIEYRDGRYKDVVDIRKFSQTRRLYGWSTKGITVTYEELNALINLIERMVELAHNKEKVPIIHTEIVEEGILDEILEEFGL